MRARRIEIIEDVLAIYNGILDGIQLGSFTENKMLNILNLIVQKNTTYYIFEEGTESNEQGYKMVGFGGIRDNVEIFKVYVMPEFRGHDYGKKISLWLTNKIFKSGQIPKCWIKKQNVWNSAMKELGMEYNEKDSYEVNSYRLGDLEAYVNAKKKYDIDNIKEKWIERRVGTWEEYRRKLGRC